MNKKSKRVLAGAGAALLGVLGVSFAASAAGPRNGKAREDYKYKGPGPNMPGNMPQPGPGGKIKPTAPSAKRPTDLAPWDLWVAPDCSDVMVGANWRDETAGPAIDAWLDDGIPRMEALGGLSVDPQFSPERVVREILGPYAPLCIDTWPWRDVQLAQSPEPSEDDYASYEEYLGEWDAWDSALAAQRDKAMADDPKLGALIAEVRNEVITRALAQEGEA